MLVKGKDALRFAAKPAKEVWAVLAFCADEGLANDAANSLITSWTKRDGDHDVTRLDDDAIKKDPSLLFDNLEAVSLLGEARVLRVRTSGDKIGSLLIEVIEQGDRHPARYAAKLVIECGSLPTKSKLRAAASKAELTACLQLYAEESSDVEFRIRSALSDAGTDIDEDAMRAFVGDLPGHRALANSEIEKLCLYARGLDRNISRDDIQRLSATDLDQNLSTAIANALDGAPARAHAALDRLAVAGTSGISILRALQFETLRMVDAHTRIAEGDSSPGMKLRPPVWNNEWPAYRARLAKWPQRRLMKILERIYEAELQAKKNSASTDPVVRMLINEISRAAEAVG